MYTLNAATAREADQFSNYLKETGKYVGKFIRAEKLVSTGKGTHGIGLTFEANDKQTTKFDLWTMDKDNKPLNGMKSINAIMACMRLRGLQPSQGVVEKWDYDTRKTVKVNAEIFPDLLGKPIGVVMRNTEYAKMKDRQYTGETGWRLEFYAAFDAKDELTASEILDKKIKPEKLSAMLSTLTDRPLANKPHASSHSSNGYDMGQSTQDEATFASDDEIPF